MKNKLFTAILFAASLAAGAPARAVVIDAALTPLDHHGSDESGKFYYDLYKITNTTGEDLKLRITMDPNDSMRPFFGYTYNLSALPSSNWDSGAPSVYDQLETMSSSTPGETIGLDGVFSTPVEHFSGSVLLAIATFDYIGDPGFAIGAYTLTITGEKYPGGGECSDCIGEAAIFTDATLSVTEILAVPGAVPAPLTPALLLTGLAGLALTRRRKTA